MARIVPTVTAYSPGEYKKQIETAQRLSSRISLDFMDGVFTPKKNINPIQAYWSPDTEVDIHLMYQNPATQLETLISLNPNLVIIHAEADVNFEHYFKELSNFGIKKGVALLPKTQPTHITHILQQVDHVLIFSGNLGSFGGRADLNLLAKVHQIRTLKSQVEISWDGGINDQNAKELVAGGINILNVGGFIQNAENPQNAYDTLEKIAK